MELFLIAHIAGRTVAIPADDIDSAVDIGEIVAVPGAHGAVRGLAALRSRVVTVIDTGLALGLAPTHPDVRRAVITRADGHHYAFLVEALEDVVGLECQPLSSGVTLRHGWALAGTGLVERAGEPLLVVDLARIVPAAPALAA